MLDDEWTAVTATPLGHLSTRSGSEEGLTLTRSGRADPGKRKP
jgi:hypothetical protein